jgi:hypothetical protein
MIALIPLIIGWLLFFNGWLYSAESKDALYTPQAQFENFFSTKEHPDSDQDTFAEFIEDPLVSLLKTVLGETIFDISGYYYHPTQNGVYGEGEINDKVRVTLINGILNFPEHHSANLEMFSATHAHVNIHYIFRSCEGWSRDMVRCLFSKAGYISDQAQLLANTWKKLIDEMGGVTGGGTIIHYAHSIGGTETYAAKNLLNPDELKMIKVITLGSPTLIPEGEFGSVINYASRRDGVCLLDIVNFIQGLLDPDMNIIYLDTFLGIPLVDHPLSVPSYSELIEELGKKFIAEYCSDSRQFIIAIKVSKLAYAYFNPNPLNPVQTPSESTSWPDAIAKGIAQLSIINTLLLKPSNLIHECGHAIAAMTCFVKASPKIVVKWATGMTEYYSSYGLTKFGGFLGEETAKLFVTAAGLFAPALFALGEFGLAHGLHESHPWISDALNYHGLSQLFNLGLYGISAFFSSNMALANDFMYLWYMGDIHPLIPMVLLVGIPLCAFAAFKYLEYRKEAGN